MNAGRKAAEAATPANSVGETVTASDVNWIMMVHQLTEREEWRCSGIWGSCKNAYECHTGSHDESVRDTYQEPRESDFVLPKSNTAASPAKQPSAVELAHQSDIRPESVNPVNLSNTAKLVVDSVCVDRCCPLDFATQLELKEGRFINASAANTIKLKHYGTRVVEGWTRDVNGAEISLKKRFNVFDVKSPLLSTSNLRKHGYSVLLDQQQTIQKNGTTIALTDQNGLPTLELRLASRAGEIDERMCAPVEEIGEEARRATPMFVPRGPSEAERRAHEIHHMPYRSWCVYCVRGRGKESPHLRGHEHSDDGIPVVQMDYALLHNTGDRDAKITFLTMVDNSSGSMVATAVQKKGHEMFEERYLLKSLESFGVTGGMVLQTDKETGPIDVAKHVAPERKATTIIRQTPEKSSQSNAYVERAYQTVEAMVRTMKEAIEDKAKVKLSATEDITTWMIRHAAFLQTRFLVGRDGKHHSKDDITKTTRVNFFHLEQQSMRESETKRLSPAKSIPDSFQAFGLEEPSRATSTSSEQHRACTQQDQSEQGTIKRSGTVTSSGAREEHHGHREARKAKWKFGCQKNDTGQ